MKLCKIILAVMLLSSCDSAVKNICGEPEGDEKMFVDSLNAKYGSVLSANPVPCYPGYFQISLKMDFDSVTINYFEAIVNQRNYSEILIYDKSNKLVRGNAGSM